MDASLLQPVVLPLRHYLLIGVGEWGWATLNALARALDAAHPELVDANEWVYLSGDGWGWFNWLPHPALRSRRLSINLSGATAAPVSADWLKEMNEGTVQILDAIFHSATSQAKAQRLKTLGYEPVLGDQSILDVYLIGRIDDPFAQSVLLDLVRLLQRMRPKSLQFTLGFFFAVDSPCLPRLSPDDRKALLTFLDEFDHFLAEDAKRPDVFDDGVGWCYVVDTLDRDGRPLARGAGEKRGEGDPIVLLAEIVASYLALLIGSEIRERPEYHLLALNKLAKSAGLDPERGYCSAFSCGAAVFPVQEIVRRSTWRLGADLLQQFDLTRQPDRGTADDLAREFFITHNLRRPVVEARLGKDETGQPIHFAADPTIFDGVPDEVLVDRILSWDAFLARNRMGPIANAMARETQAILTETQAWIRQQVDALAMQSLNGVATARLLCENLSREIKSEEQNIAREAQPRGCLAAIFAPSPSLPREPTTFPDLKPLQHALQRALGERVERLAVWVRYVYLALFETAFVLAAWGYIRAALQVSLGSAVGLPPALVDPWIFPLAILTINMIAAWQHIARIEKRIAAARSRLIQAIQQKYAAAVRWNILKHTTEIYGKLVATLEQERAALERWSKVTAEARAELLNDLSADPGYQPLCLETVLIPSERYGQFVHAYTSSEVGELFELWLGRKTLPAWREAEPCAVRESTLAFAEEQVSGRLARLSIENYAESREDQHALAKLVERLQRQTRLQMTLGSLTTASPRYFLGVHDGRMTQVSRWLVERDWTKVISTRDPSRLVFAPTVHGLPLRDLKIWESLQ